jgi:NAD(P)H-dependent flavin oxidoreductase YrpB (nitropropane dioxygenase family)
MLQTRFCERFGVTAPIVADPMGPDLSGPELVAAVSNAGGFGILQAQLCPPPLLRDEIAHIRTLTNKPFGVNFVLHFPHRAHGWPFARHRTLRTRFVREWLDNESETQDSRFDEPVIGHTIIGGAETPIQRFASLPPNIHATGDIESMSLLAGQSVGLINEIRPAAEILRGSVSGAERLIRELYAKMA